MLGSDHADVHHAYDGVPVPSRDVMRVFLAEAALLSALHVSVTAVEMIDDALYEGRVVRIDRAQEQRRQRLEVIHSTLSHVSGIQVIPDSAVELTVERVGTLAEAA